jgi:hypothetical protein
VTLATALQTSSTATKASLEGLTSALTSGVIASIATNDGDVVDKATEIDEKAAQKLAEGELEIAQNTAQSASDTSKRRLRLAWFPVTLPPPWRTCDAAT